jgi:hypothetical protein
VARKALLSLENASFLLNEGEERRRKLKKLKKSWRNEKT